MDKTRKALEFAAADSLSPVNLRAGMEVLSAEVATLLHFLAKANLVNEESYLEKLASEMEKLQYKAESKL